MYAIVRKAGCYLLQSSNCVDVAQDGILAHYNPAVKTTTLNSNPKRSETEVCQNRSSSER